MSSLVNDFIINPVLRQARRLSEASHATLTTAAATAAASSPGDDPSRDPSPTQAVVNSELSADYAPLPGPAISCPDPFDPRTVSPSAQTPANSDAMSSPMEPTVDDGTPRDHLGFPVGARRTTQIPEDDGMKPLRSRIHSIRARDIPAPEKARLLHDLLLESYHASRALSRAEAAQDAARLSGMPTPVGETREELTPQGPLESLRFWNGDGSAPEKFILSESDLTRTYAPIRRNKSQSGAQTPAAVAEPASPEILEPPLGCQHYERNIKMQCATCDKWYPCRLCHDAEEDHRLPRFETRHMLCMLCGTPQKASDVCVGCGEMVAQYYCSICKLWENRQSKPIYHCSDCGICRRGLGLGKDYIHCKTCCACIPTSIETSHKCIERSTDCNCPICGEYMFTSPRPVVFMTCGHSIHKKCYDQHMNVSYKCPICNKSLANMETQFRNLDVAIQGQPMPVEFRDTKAVILCNDCSGRCTVPYHWLGLKCGICLSYNTVELQILGGAPELQNTTGEQPSDVVAGVPNLEGGDAGQGAAVATEATRNPVIPTGRRRHSSQAVEVPQRASDLLSGSFPPRNARSGHLTGQFETDSESDDGILGFWGFSADDDDSSYVEDSDEDMSDEDDEDEDDDDDNEILLIGHR